jgi:hypothetical protein
VTPRKTARSAVFVLLYVVSIMGHAEAQFETRSSFSMMTAPGPVAVGDFNHDGKLDIAVSSYIPMNGVTILLGNGDGTFRAGESYVFGDQLAEIATADLRHIGKLDLVVGDYLSDYVYVLLGNGDGTFQPAVPYRTDRTPFFVSTGDFTDHGKMDIIAVAGPGGSCDCVEVLPGNGDGTFQAPIVTPVPYGVDGYALAAGRFDEDSKLDVAVVGVFGSANQVDILLGNGDGTFRPHGYYEIPDGLSDVTTADFNGDGKSDLAVVSLYANSAGVLLGNGDGTFQPPVYYSSEFPTLVAAHDLDGDGKQDLVVENSGELGIPAGISVLKGNGDGTFQPGVFYPAGEEGGFMAVGDFNNDGKPDLVQPDSNTQLIITLLNTGTVTFSPTTPLTFPTQLIGTTSAPLTATLTNNGTSSLTISSVSFSGKPFKVRTTCQGSVPAGGNCTITAVFTAQVEGVTSGTVTIKDSASSKPQVVELTGTGTVVELSPPKLNFPPQKVGTKSAPKNVQLTNTGSTALDFTYFMYIDGTNYKDFSQTNTCSSSLNPGASCIIAVTFAPKKTGTRSAFITITDTGGGSPQTVPLSGTGD